MKNDPKVSVILATYNGAQFLEAQLASLVSQTLRPLEVIVSDDGSKDGTVEIVKDFIGSAPFRVVLVSGPGTGIGDNFLSAVSHSRGELIAWCDQDDVWYPIKLRTCVDVLYQYSADLVAHMVRPFDSDSGQHADSAMQTIDKLTILEKFDGDPWYCPQGFATVFRRQLVEFTDWSRRPGSHFHDGLMHHDELAYLAAYFQGKRVLIPDVLADYRQHPSNSAGAPVRVSIVKRIRQGSDMIDRRAALVRAWVEFFEVGRSREAESVISVFTERASRYELPQWRRVLATLSAFRHGDYRSRATGGLGATSLILDTANCLYVKGRPPASDCSRELPDE